MVVKSFVDTHPNFDMNKGNSLSYGIHLTGKPVIPTPEREVEFISIPGRSSSYSIGGETYKDIEISFGIRVSTLGRSYETTAKEIRQYLGYDLERENFIVFNEFPNWRFSILDIQPFKLEFFPSMNYFTAEITMLCEPFKYSPQENRLYFFTGDPVQMELSLEGKASQLRGWTEGYKAENIPDPLHFPMAFNDNDPIARENIIPSSELSRYLDEGDASGYNLKARSALPEHDVRANIVEDFYYKENGKELWSTTLGAYKKDAFTIEFTNHPGVYSYARSRIWVSNQTTYRVRADFQGNVPTIVVRTYPEGNLIMSGKDFTFYNDIASQVTIEVMSSGSLNRQIVKNIVVTRELENAHWYPKRKTYCAFYMRTPIDVLAQLADPNVFDNLEKDTLENRLSLLDNLNVKLKMRIDYQTYGKHTTGEFILRDKDGDWFKMSGVIPSSEENVKVLESQEFGHFRNIVDKDGKIYFGVIFESENPLETMEAQLMLDKMVPMINMKVTPTGVHEKFDSGGDQPWYPVLTGRVPPEWNSGMQSIIIGYNDHDGVKNKDVLEIKWGLRANDRFTVDWKNKLVLINGEIKNSAITRGSWAPFKVRQDRVVIQPIRDGVLKWRGVSLI